MAYRITGNCIACGNCSVVCPSGAIDDGFHSTAGGLLAENGPGKTGAEDPYMLMEMYRITDNCNLCGKCVDICPTNAVIEG
ncbi:MAG: 4Fe-4S binding protein [Bacillota bacterium]